MSESSAGAAGPSAPDSLTLRFRLAPRDVVDCIVGPLAGLSVGAVILGAPVAIVFLATNSIDWALVSFLIGAVLTGAVTGFSSVYSLTLDREGIRFHRLLGWPRFVQWPRVTSIREVSRGEALFVTSLKPWRALCASLTYRCWFRIHWRESYFLFPPYDVDAFREAVHRWRPDLIMLVEREPPDASERLPETRETGNPYQSPLSDLIKARPEKETDDSNLT